MSRYLKGRTRSQVLSLLVLAASIVLLAWLVFRNWPLVVGHISNINPLPLFVAFGVYSVDLLLAVLAWGLILNKIAGFKDFRTNFRIYGMTNVARRIPGSVWYALGRVAMYESVGIRKRTVTVGIALELFVIVVSGILLGVVLAPLPLEEQETIRLWLGLIAVLAFASMNPRLVRKALSWIEKEPVDISISYLDTLSYLAAYGAVWIVGGLTLYLVIASLNPLPASAIPMVIGAWSISGAVASITTLSPSGFGIKEITLTLLLSALIPVSLAAVVAILMRLLLTTAEVIWAFLASRL